MMNRLVFHKGSCNKKIPGPKLDIDFLNFENRSNWPSSLMYSLKKYFKEVVYLISVPDVKYARPPVYMDGVRYEVVAHSDLISKWINECDVYWHRATPHIKPPTKSLSIYYSSSSIIMPGRHANEWNVVLTSMSPNQRGSRIKNNLYSWLKGDNPDFWCPDNSEKEFDFVVVGRRGKNIECVRELAKKHPQIRIAAVGWAGGYDSKREEFKKPPKPVFNLPNVIEFGRLVGHDKVRDVLRRSKVAIAITAHGEEGFPMQTQMEYSLTGLFFGYDGTMLKDNYYVSSYTGSKLSVNLLDNWEVLGQKARQYAVNHFSSDVSADCLMKIIKEKI